MSENRLVCQAHTANPTECVFCEQELPETEPRPCPELAGVVES